MREWELRLIQQTAERYPPPQCFDIAETKRPTVALSVWESLARRGYAKISDHARCGFENIPGTFVTLTEAALRQ